jgi:hypothetical protein
MLNKVLKNFRTLFYFYVNSEGHPAKGWPFSKHAVTDSAKNIITSDGEIFCGQPHKRCENFLV